MSSVFAIALAWGFTPALGDPDWRERERATAVVTAACEDPAAWRAVWDASHNHPDPEVRARLAQAWRGRLAHQATAMIPPWHPLWPDASCAPDPVPRGILYDQLVDFDSKSKYAADRFVTERKEPVARCTAAYDCAGDFAAVCYEPYDWVYMFFPHRDVFRRWVVRELALKGDIDKLRDIVRIACEKDADDTTAGAGIWRDAGGMTHRAFVMTNYYDPTLLNPRYFDGRRANRHDR